MSGSEETSRLERLWAGEFGDEYVDRNLNAQEGRRDFWAGQLAKLDVRTVLEVGCNVGANLVWIAETLGPENVFGVDVNEKALKLLHERIPGVNSRLAPGQDLPFEDGAFDLVFTAGVLIHQPPESLHGVMSEIVRCSRRYVICGEYYAEEPTEVPYRGQKRALFKQDYGGLYLRLFPELALIERGFLSPDEGHWDRLTYWVFEKEGGE
jgi:pseudaminic acid biosynthesis-associated methylase